MWYINLHAQLFAIASGLGFILTMWYIITFLNFILTMWYIITFLNTGFKALIRVLY